MFASVVYRSSPRWVQEGMISARGYGRARLREGKAFERHAADASRSQWLDEDGLAEFHRRHVERLFAVVAHSIPHYRPLASRLRRPAGWRDVLAEMPLLDKDQVRAAGASIIAAPAGRPRFVSHTSGTTGPALPVTQDLPAIRRENAFVWRQLRWAGIERGSRRAWIRGDLAVPASQTAPPYWRRSLAENMLVMSSYHLAASSADDYLDALARWRPAVIQAYPSSVAFLARHLRQAGRHYPGTAPRAVVTSSEMLTSETRALIEERFGCPVFDWYGQLERVAAIGTCERGTAHVIEDYGLVEFLPVGDGLHEVVGTGFNNRVMPLIRYRTGDLVELDDPDDRSCPCGRRFRVVRRIVGRDDDTLTLPDGRAVARLGQILTGVGGLLDAQIRQDVRDRIDILVIPSRSWGADAAATLERRARERLGASVAIRIRLVDAIPRSAGGKHRRVVRGA